MNVSIFLFSKRKMEFLRGRRVTTDDIREGLVDVVRGNKCRRLALRRILKAFGRTADDYVTNGTNVALAPRNATNITSLTEQYFETWQRQM